MKKYIRPAIVVTLLLTVVTGLFYPGIVTALAQLIFPAQANGSLHYASDGKTVIGSDLIGQYWTSPQYFHGRPSATVSVDGSKAQPYNAQNSAASNLGPTNKVLIDGVKQNEDAVRKENPNTPLSTPVPVDLVTASGSGLDPDISVAGALFQVPRIATQRGLSEDAVKKIITDHTQHRFLWVFGDEYVNVLDLNLALDHK
ncbi:potassium-transporting ATPase subunit KdpC [Tengunoibacter tsumagoiensis]